MKELIKIKFFVITVVALLGLTLTSCNDERYEPQPVRLDDVNGNYKARLVTSKGNQFNEKIIDFIVKDTVITFKDFPVREIVRTIVTDPVKADSILSKVGKVEHKLHFKSKLNTSQNVVELTFEPENLIFQMPLDGITKNINVQLKAPQKGFFVGYDHSLRFGFVADKISVDGVDLNPYQNLNYDIPISLKN